MTPNGTNTAVVTTTVFDLTAFDDVKLTKTITLPTQPTTLDEALAAVGNDKAKLLNVIHEGLIAEAKETARVNMTGFHVVSEEGEVDPLEYIRDIPVVDANGVPVLNEDGTPKMSQTGKYADEAKGKLINNVILSFAKMNGFSKDLSKEKKRELKEQATAFLRNNPAAIAGIQG